MERVILVGHSIGGWVGLKAAVGSPGRVSRMIMASPMGLDFPPVASPDLAGLDQEAFATAVFAKLGLIATAQSYGFGAEWETCGGARSSNANGRAATWLPNDQRGCTDPEMTAMLPVIEAETLLVWGRQDGLTPVEQEKPCVLLFPTPG